MPVQPAAVPGQTLGTPGTPHAPPSGQPGGQSSTPPQPLPIRPQYCPPPGGVQVAGTHAGSPPQTLVRPPPPQVAAPVQPPQSSVPPQPSPITPQNFPPSKLQEAMGLQFCAMHTPFWQSCPALQVPQSSSRPHWSPITPQNCAPGGVQLARWQSVPPRQMLPSQLQPAVVHAPQSLVNPQPSPITPQY